LVILISVVSTAPAAVTVPEHMVNAQLFIDEDLLLEKQAEFTLLCTSYIRMYMWPHPVLLIE
jgi:hypothetical protein